MVTARPCFVIEKHRVVITKLLTATTKARFTATIKPCIAAKAGAVTAKARASIAAVILSAKPHPAAALMVILVVAVDSAIAFVLVTFFGGKKNESKAGKQP